VEGGVSFLGLKLFSEYSDTVGPTASDVFGNLVPQLAGELFVVHGTELEKALSRL